MPAALRRELGHRGSASPFDRPLSGARELAFTVAPLADMKAIGATRPIHATVNDVLLAVISGGLRDWLGSDAAAGRHLRAQIPVSLHHRDEDPGGMGNRDSFINVDLPVAEADPLARLDLISAQTRTRKNSGDAVELYDLFHALGRTRHVAGAVQRFADSGREFSVAISNVPGPPSAVTIAGRPVAQLFSSSEPGPHHVLRISAISCAGEVGIGLCTDPQALPGITGLAAAIDDSYAELREAVAGSAGD
jgi:WS/DGAT/MGAT family acyltransferase